MGFYVESADRPYQSRLAAEDIHVGTLVHEDGSDAYELLDADTHSSFDGLATAPRRGDYIAKEEDETTAFKYLASENDRVPALPLADRDVIKARTIKETNSGITSSPNISDGDTVVVVDTSDGDAPTSAGRIVEDGYSNDENDDNGSTTFSLSNDNAIGVGKAYKDSATGFDEVVRVEIRRDL
jgi:hypothetical protein